MTLAEIVLKLRHGLSQWSTLFGTQLSVSAAAISGSNINLTTTVPHGLVANDIVYLSWFYERITGTISGTGPTYTVVTDANHDLTRNEAERREVKIYIKTQNFTTPTEVTLIGVANRRTFTFSSAASPFSNDTDCELIQFHYGAANSPSTVASAPTATTLVVTPTGSIGGLPTDLTGRITSSKVTKAMRVSAAVDYQTASESYTKQGNDELWAFVVMDNFTANRSKTNTTDSQYMSGRQQDFSQMVIGNFSIYIFVPNKGDVLAKTNGRSGRDIIETIRQPLFKAILNTSLSSGLACPTQNVVTYAGDGYHDYAGPYYVHRFQFQQVFEIDVADTSSPYQGGDRAFRDIDLSLVNTFDIGSLGNPDAAYGVSIDLDDDPLP